MTDKVTDRTKLETKLQELGEAEEQLGVLLNALREAQDQVLTDEQRQTIDDLATEATPKLDTAEEKISALRDEIKSLALKVKETVKGNSKMVVYVPAKDKWDGAKLEGYAIVHEDVLKCKTTGKPSVQIRDA